MCNINSEIYQNITKSSRDSLEIVDQVQPGQPSNQNIFTTLNNSNNNGPTSEYQMKQNISKTHIRDKEMNQDSVQKIKANQGKQLMPMNYQYQS